MLRASVLALVLAALSVAPLTAPTGTDEPLLASGARADGEALPQAAECAPVPEARVAHTRTGRAYVALSWAPCDGASGYRVYRGTTPDDLRPLGEINGPSLVDDDVRAGGTYHYAVVLTGRDLPAALQGVPVKVA